MKRTQGWLKQIRALLRKRAVEREMDEEMAFHLERETEENLRQGMSPDEARRAALISFGGVERFKEQVREARWVRVPENLLADLLHAIRRLRRRPSFSATVVLTLAVGLAALATGWGIVYGVLLRPLPYPDGERLVRVWQTLPGWSQFPVSWPVYERWREGTRAFAGVAAYDDVEPVVTGEGGARRVRAVPATANLAAVLRVEPERGRWYTEEEDLRGASVVVVSHEFWTSRLGAEPGSVGSVLRLDDEPYTVIGVMPPQVGFPTGTSLWLPLGPDARQRGWNSQSLAVVGRLAPGTTVEEAGRDVSTVTERFVAEGQGPEVGASVVQVREDVAGDVSRTLMLALGAAVALLLIGALNVANLFLARGAAARHEAGVRAVLGGGRLRMVREFVFEGVLLSVAGAGAGLWTASQTIPTLLPALSPRVPRIEGVAVDAPVAAVVLAVAAGLGMLLGLLSAGVASAGASASPGREARSRLTSGRGARAFRSVMVAGQVAAVFVLVSGAGLLLRSLDSLLAADRGFEESRLLALVEPAPPESRYPDDAARDALYRRMAERVEAIPGVRGAALVAPLPFSGSERRVTLTPAGWDGGFDVGLTEATAGALDVLGVPLLAGRGFEPSEGPADAVALVGESLARRLGGQARVVGSILPLDGGSVEVVGVVADVRQEGLAGDPLPRLWVPYGWAPDDDLSLVVATEADPANLLPDVHAGLVEVEPALAAERLLPMERLVGAAAAFPRFRAALVLVLSLAAALLAAIGIYGVTSYAVVERRRELSIRSALGAGGRRVVGAALKRELTVVAAGLVVGLPTALLAARTLRGFLHGITPDDPLVHGLTAASILVIAALAVLLPALRAVRSDPAEALRME